MRAARKIYGDGYDDCTDFCGRDKDNRKCKSDGTGRIKTSGETDAKEPESTGKLDPIPIAVTGEYDGEWDDSQTPIITSRCDRVFVQGDGYEALKSALSAKMMRWRLRTKRNTRSIKWKR